MKYFPLLLLMAAPLVQADLPRPDYQLAFSDDFDAPTLNLQNWRHRLGGTNRAENVSIQDGNLVIRYDEQDGQLHGGGVITNFGLGYGYYETRAKLFGGTGGLHSSFWTAGISGNGRDLPRNHTSFEIDFFEVDSNNTSSIPPCFHYWQGKLNTPNRHLVMGSDGKTPLYKSLLNADDDYFICGCEYLPDRCIWYLNGVKVCEYWHHDMTGRPNVWLTALAGYKPAGTADSAKLPGESRWDYFRFYTMPFKGENLVVNPSFDDNNRETYSLPPEKCRLDAPASWWEDGDQDAINVETTIVHSGTGSLRLGKSGSYQCEASQKLTCIANGTYDFSCYVRNDSHVKAEVFVNDRHWPVPETTGKFIQLIFNDIPVSCGEATYGIRAQGEDTCVYVDDVFFACQTGTDEFNRKRPINPWKEFIDDNDPTCCAKTGEWLLSSLHGYRTPACYSSSPDASITWTIPVKQDGTFQAQFYKIVHPESLHAATCTVTVNGELKFSTTVDTTTGNAGWQTLATMALKKGDDVKISLLRTPIPEDSGMKYLRADSARLLPSTNPWELDFKLVWKKRFVFDAELPFPEGITYLPCANYTAKVNSLPAEMTLETKTGEIIMRIPAPDKFTPPYTMHVGSGGSYCIYVTKDNMTHFIGSQKVPSGTPWRSQDSMKNFVLKGNGGMEQPVGTMSAGAGQADVRFVTRGRENAIYFENGRMFFTFSTRGLNGCLGVASFDPAKFDVRLEGNIFFDYGDNQMRADIAAHLYYDDIDDEWRAWVSNFASSGPKGRAVGGINVAWSKENPLHGLHIMKSKSLGLTDMHEDPSGIWDSGAKKWRLFICHFLKGIKAEMLESDNWDGPYSRLAGPVPEDSTGTTIQWMNGTRYCFSGSAEHALYVYSYPDLKKLGKLKLDMEPWGDTPLETPWGVMKTNNSRVWPCFAELPEGYPYKYILLTMDRINIPGWKNPNWTYGGLYIYGANPPQK